MNPGEEERGAFRRNVLIIALLHVAIIGGIILFSLWKNAARSGENISWLDGGGMPAGGEDAQPSPAPEDTPADEEATPTPTPEPDRMYSPAPEGSPAPSEITLAAPSPVLVAVPTPTPTPTPEPIASPTPKPSPKPKASPKPKPKASASPRKHPSPHKSPTPGEKDESDQNDQRDASPKPKTASHSAGGASGEPGTTPGTGGGHRGGAGHAGGGNTESDFGWYTSMLHDRFYDHWDQPTSIVTATSQFSTIVKIRIERDGSISDVSLAQSSGNDVMDQSVMEAARRVTHVDPLPEGMGGGGAYEVKIDFELSQQSQ